ncbi:MAG TPA: tetratricopeptide repeat protein, partial [Acetobacteraceae bacterium]|nr:tetratricopeptide repeat protein [Acetobacteraceae bacterium]
MLQQLMGRAAEAHKHGRFDEAEGLYLQVLQTRPDLFEAQHSLGVLRGQQGRHEEALALFEAALRVHPDAAGVLVNCGMVLHNLKRHTEALASFNKALAISPDYALALNNRGPVLSALGRDRDALKSYIAALAVRPDYADAYNNMGGLLTELGRLDDAKAALHRALELNPRLMGAYVNLGKCKIFTADDPHLAAMQALERDMGLSKADRTRLHFALGKAYADIKDHNRAFESLSHGNALKRAQIVYDEAATLRLFKSTEATFTRDLVSAKAG